MMILSCLVAAYTAAFRLYHQQAAMAWLQENALVITRYFSSVFAKAGYCGTATRALRGDDSTPAYVWCQKERIGKASHVGQKPGTDAVTVHYADEVSAYLREPLAKGSLSVIASEDARFQVNDPIVIADGLHADMNKVQTVTRDGHSSQQRISLATPSSYNFAPHTSISQRHSDTYYIAATSRLSPWGEPIYALYREENHQTKAELVEGVTDMVIHYAQEKDANTVKGVDITVQLTTPFAPELSKTFYHTVALREP